MLPSSGELSLRRLQEAHFNLALLSASPLLLISQPSSSEPHNATNDAGMLTIEAVAHELAAAGDILVAEACWSFAQRCASWLPVHYAVVPMQPSHLLLYRCDHSHLCLHIYICCSGQHPNLRRVLPTAYRMHLNCGLLRKQSTQNWRFAGCPASMSSRVSVTRRKRQLQLRWTQLQQL